MCGPIYDEDLERVKSITSNINEFTLTALPPGKRFPISAVFRLLQYLHGPLLPSIGRVKIANPDAEAMQYWSLICTPSLASISLDGIGVEHTKALSYLLDTLRTEAPNLSAISIGPGKVPPETPMQCIQFSQLRELSLSSTATSYDAEMHAAIVKLDKLEVLSLQIDRDERGWTLFDNPNDEAADPILEQLKSLHLSANIDFLTAFMPRIGSKTLERLSLTLLISSDEAMAAMDTSNPSVSKKKKMKKLSRAITSEPVVAPKLFGSIIHDALSTWNRTLAHLYISRNDDGIVWPEGPMPLSFGDSDVSCLLSTQITHLDISGWSGEDVVTYILDPEPTSARNLELEVLHLPLNGTVHIPLSSLAGLSQRFPNLHSLRADVVDPSGITVHGDTLGVRSNCNMKTLFVGNGAMTYPKDRPLHCVTDLKYYPLRVAQYLDRLFPNLDSIKTTNCQEDIWILVEKLVKMCQDSRIYHSVGEATP